MWYLECPSSESCVMAIWESLGNVGNRTYIYFGRWRSKKHINLYLKETIISIPYEYHISMTNKSMLLFLHIALLSLPHHPQQPTPPTHSNPTNPPGWPPPDVASDWMDRCEAPRPGLGPGLGSFRPQGFVGGWTVGRGDGSMFGYIWWFWNASVPWVLKKTTLLIKLGVVHYSL